MAIHLLCLTTNSGLPIFTKKKGECDNLPFSTVASLNGFHMFFKSLGIKLQTTHAEDGWIYLWRDFHNAITVIVCGRGLSELVLEQLAELTFGAISLFVNRDEISVLERVKRELKNFTSIVDAAMEASLALMPGLTDCILSMENVHMLQKLQDFSGQCGSLFCSLVIGQRLAVATEGWWDLDIVDREVLLLLLNSFNSLQNDVAIYLPKKSPTIAYRFVTIPLAPNTVLCVICGAGPNYNELLKTTQSIFRNEALGLLQNAERCLPRSLPDQLELDANPLAMILINLDTLKCVFSRNLQQLTSNMKRHTTTVGTSNASGQRLDMLKKFFYHTLEATKLLESDDRALHAEIIDQYWCSDYHKCHALSDDSRNVVFILYMASVPTHTMKFITQKILATILQERNFCW